MEESRRNQEETGEHFGWGVTILEEEQLHFSSLISLRSGTSNVYGGLSKSMERLHMFLFQGNENAAGRRFGFVRFLGVMEDSRFVERLNGIWMGSYKLRANIAKYGRNVNVTTMKQVPKQAPQLKLKSVVVKPQKLKSVIVSKEDCSRNEGSFADVVKGSGNTVEGGGVKEKEGRRKVTAGQE
ncbi:hypothetical protein L1887_14860 [Cichorium endivia]|nr:hypothetical protein L1887_14860 [Cichorium endivia]